jgi:hypothetical protein
VVESINFTSEETQFLLYMSKTRFLVFRLKIFKTRNLTPFKKDDRVNLCYFSEKFSPLHMRTELEVKLEYHKVNLLCGMHNYHRSGDKSMTEREGLLALELTVLAAVDSSKISVHDRLFNLKTSKMMSDSNLLRGPSSNPLRTFLSATGTSLFT